MWECRVQRVKKGRAIMSKLFFLINLDGGNQDKPMIELAQ